MDKLNPTSPPASLPAIDEHVVEEEGRLELIDGELVIKAPAEEPHGRQHSRLSYLLEAHVSADYLVAADMLTRSAQDQDFAPDCSVYPRIRDEHGKRKLDALSFEVVGQQPMSIATRKAAVLVARGVRRVFAIDVEESTVCEWDLTLSVWRPLPREGSIRDEALVRPLPVAALLDAADADDAVFDALRAKNNPALLDYGRTNRLDGRREGLEKGREEGLEKGREEGLEKGREEGLEKGLEKGREEGLEKGLEKGREEGQLLARRQTVIDLCEVLSVPLTVERVSALSALTLPQFDALISHLKAQRNWPQTP